MAKIFHSDIFAVGIASAYLEERQPNGQLARIFKPTMHAVAPYPENIAAEIRSSENKHVSISGIPGCGKTILMAKLLTLFPEYRRMIFCFKANDYYLKFTNIRLDATKYLPDPFANPAAFLGAFWTAFAPKNSTLQATEAYNELLKVLESIHSWDELKEVVRKGKETKDSNLRNAYGIIENGMGVVEKYKPHPIKPLRTDVVLDFTGFGDNNKAKAFFAELLLRQIYSELASTTQTTPIIISIDEAHRLFANGENSATILVEMAKEGRQAKACLWLSSQNYTELPSKVISTFAFKFLFYTDEEKDLKAVRQVAGFLPYVVTTLPDHMFINLRDRESLAQYRAQIMYYAWQGEQLAIDGKLEIEEIAPIARKKRPLIDTEEFLALALDMLGKKPIFPSELAGVISKKYGFEFGATKKLASGILKGLKAESEGKLDSLPFDLRNKEPSEGEVEVKARLLYYKSGKDEYPNESQLHIWQQNWTAVEYKRTGYRIVDEARQTERNERKPDLIVEKSNKQISVEIETGLKHGKLEDLKLRMVQSEKENRDTLIVVPNNAVRETYAALFPKALVTCFYPFIESLKREQSTTAAAEREEAKEGEARREGEGGEEEHG